MAAASTSDGAGVTGLERSLRSSDEWINIPAVVRSTLQDLAGAMAQQRSELALLRSRQNDRWSAVSEQVRSLADSVRELRRDLGECASAASLAETNRVLLRKADAAHVAAQLTGLRDVAVPTQKHVAALAAALEGKADAVDLRTLRDEVHEARALVMPREQVVEAVQACVRVDELNQALRDVHTALQERALQTNVTRDLAVKADSADVMRMLAGKVSEADLAPILAQKADLAWAADALETKADASELHAATQRAVTHEEMADAIATRCISPDALASAVRQAQDTAGERASLALEPVKTSVTRAREQAAQVAAELDAVRGELHALSSRVDAVPDAAVVRDSVRGAITEVRELARAHTLRSDQLASMVSGELDALRARSDAASADLQSVLDARAQELSNDLERCRAECRGLASEAGDQACAKAMAETAKQCDSVLASSRAALAQTRQAAEQRVAACEQRISASADAIAANAAAAADAQDAAQACQRRADEAAGGVSSVVASTRQLADALASMRGSCERAHSDANARATASLGAVHDAQAEASRLHAELARLRGELERVADPDAAAAAVQAALSRALDKKPDRSEMRAALRRKVDLDTLEVQLEDRFDHFRVLLQRKADGADTHAALDKCVTRAELVAAMQRHSLTQDIARRLERPLLEHSGSIRSMRRRASGATGSSSGDAGAAMQQRRVSGASTPSLRRYPAAITAESLAGTPPALEVLAVDPALPVSYVRDARRDDQGLPSPPSPRGHHAAAADDDDAAEWRVPVTSPDAYRVQHVMDADEVSRDVARQVQRDLERAEAHLDGRFSDDEDGDEDDDHDDDHDLEGTSVTKRSQRRSDEEDDERGHDGGGSRSSSESGNGGRAAPDPLSDDALDASVSNDDAAPEPDVYRAEPLPPGVQPVAKLFSISSYIGPDSDSATSHGDDDD